MVHSQSCQMTHQTHWPGATNKMPMASWVAGPSAARWVVVAAVLHHWQCMLKAHELPHGFVEQLHSEHRSLLRMLHLLVVALCRLSPCIVCIVHSHLLLVFPAPSSVLHTQPSDWGLHLQGLQLWVGLTAKMVGLYLVARNWCRP